MENNVFPNRRNHRLKDYDYSSSGFYFVTICTYEKQCVLASVGSDALVAPSATGLKVIECWKNIERLNDNVRLDKFVLMPNHIHGIVVLESGFEEVAKPVSDYSFQISERRGRRSLQGLIKDFKSVTARAYKKEFGSDAQLWQKSFYDVIIKNEEHYKAVWKYIDDNPAKWQDDELYIS